MKRYTFATRYLRAHPGDRRNLAAIPSDRDLRAKPGPRHSGYGDDLYRADDGGTGSEDGGGRADRIGTQTKGSVMRCWRADNIRYCLGAKCREK